MPTYQYACTNPECGNQFELVQSFTDPAASECPVCGQPVRKRFGSVGVVFKGSGFYRTDSRAAASASAPSSSAKGESKSDAKPAESSTKSEKSAASAASGSGSSGGSSGKAAATA
jgi:putative FmdB family regulatory protein